MSTVPVVLALMQERQKRGKREKMCTPCACVYVCVREANISHVCSPLGCGHLSLGVGNCVTVHACGNINNPDCFWKC